MKIGIFLPNWIGDAVMAGPALRAVRERFGREGFLVGIARPYVADVLAGTGWLDDLWFYQPRSVGGRLESWKLVRRMRGLQLDLALLLTNSFRTALLAFAGGARQRVGYRRYGRGPLLTRGLDCPSWRKPAGGPMVDYYLELAYAVGCPPQPSRLELATLPQDEQAADAAWNTLGLRDDRVVSFNCSGAYGGSKLWPPEHFAALGRLVAERLDYDVLVICGPSERAMAAEVERQAAHPRVKSLAQEKVSIGLSKAAVRRSRLLVTTDSGPRHFAVAFGIPVVGLFGPTLPIWGENRFARAVHLQLPLDCAGCHKRTCPLGHHACMRDLRPEQVFRAVAAELSHARESAAA